MAPSQIDSLQAEIRRMQARVQQLESAGEQPTNRRHMLRGLGAAAVGAVASGLAFARPAAAAPAGSLNVLTPYRAYDSRVANPVGNVGLLVTGASRTLGVRNKRNPGTGEIVEFGLVPEGANAVVVNITVTGTLTGGVGKGGFLTVNPGDTLTADASSINWFGAGQTTANQLTVPLNEGGELSIICGGFAGAATHFIMDVSGYYL